MSAPLISVIVPHYNHEEYLRARLETIIRQKYENIEIILLDDGSSRGVDILREYADHPKVKCLEINGENSGSPFKQWQKGVGFASGEFAWIAESDDLASLDFLSVLIKKIQSNPDINLVFCDSNEIHSNSELDKDLKISNSTATEKVFNSDFVSKGSEFITNHLVKANSIPNVSGLLMKRQALTYMPWDYLATFRYAGDWFLYILLLENAKIAYIDKKLNYFRSHPTTTRSNKNIDGWKLYFSERLLILNYLSKKLHIDCFREYIACIEELNGYIELTSTIRPFLRSCGNSDVIIYGCGGVGQYIYEIIQNEFKDLNVIGFIDKKAHFNDNIELFGKKVMTLDHFAEMNKKVTVCIGSVCFADEIEDELKRHGISKNYFKVSR